MPGSQEVEGVRSGKLKERTEGLAGTSMFEHKLDQANKGVDLKNILSQNRRSPKMFVRPSMFSVV